MPFRVLVALLLAACGARGESPSTLPSPSERTELVAARDAVWKAWFAGDSARLVELLPERMVGMGQDRAAIIADAVAFRQAGGRLDSIAFADDEIVVRDGMAVVYARYRVHTTMREQRDSMVGTAIELFVRQDGRWINPSWHLHQPER